MQPNDFALIVAAARKEAEKLLKTADRSALQSFAPVFEIRDRNLWMVHGGVTADLGTVVAQKGDLGPRGVDGNNGRDGIDGKAGLDGANGRNGIDGADGKDGADGEDGADGRGIAKAYVSESGYLIIELTDGQKITAGYVRGKDGKTGQSGVMYGVGAGSSGGAGTDLAYDEATRILSSSTGADVTLPLFTDTDAGLSPASGGGTANFLRADGTWAAPVGGSSSYTGAATLDFGSAPGTNVVIATVTGQTEIVAGSSVKAWVTAQATADHNAYEHAVIFPARIGLACGDIIEGVGFSIYASTELRLTGDVACKWEWS